MEVLSPSPEKIEGVHRSEEGGAGRGEAALYPRI